MSASYKARLLRVWQVGEDRLSAIQRSKFDLDTLLQAHRNQVQHSIDLIKLIQSQASLLCKMPYTKIHKNCLILVIDHEQFSISQCNNSSLDLDLLLFETSPI